MKFVALALLSAFALSACSFSKDAGSEKQVVTARPQTVIDSSLSSYDRLVFAIKNNDLSLFRENLGKITIGEMNQLSSEGKSLVALSVELDRFEFAKELFTAGASPFTLSRAQESHIIVFLNSKYIPLFEESARRLMSESFVLCLKNDIKLLVGFLRENAISPIYDVCGSGTNFFTYFLRPEFHSQRDEVRKSVSSYINSDDSYSVIISGTMLAAIMYSDSDILDRLDAKCLQRACQGEYQSVLAYFRQSDIRAVLQGYGFLKDRYEGMEEKISHAPYIYALDRGPKPPPPRGIERKIPGTGIVVVPEVGVMRDSTTSLFESIDEIVRQRVKAAKAQDLIGLERTLQDLGLVDSEQEITPK